MKPPEWSNSIIKVAGTPMDSTIAFAGKFEGKRVIALGFDVGDFDFSESKNLKVLIMVLNVIQWLNPYEVEENLKMLTGRQYIANYIMQGEYELMDPKGEIHKYSFENNSKENVLLNTIEYAGEYVVTGANVKRVFVANLFDDKESDIRLEPAEKKELNFEASETTTSVVAKKSGCCIIKRSGKVLHNQSLDKTNNGIPVFEYRIFESFIFIASILGVVDFGLSPCIDSKDCSFNTLTYICLSTHCSGTGRIWVGGKI